MRVIRRGVVLILPALLVLVGLQALSGLAQSPSPVAVDPQKVLQKITDPKGVFSFKLSDEPGTWFDTGIDIFGTRSLGVGVASAANPVKAVFTIAKPDTNTVHTVSSLIWPTGAPGFPWGQGGGGLGEREVALTKPGLYAFTCKIHPYMLGAVVVDDPATPGLDFGQRLSTMGGTSLPSDADYIMRLVHTFFIATVPNNWQHYSASSSTTWNPTYPPAPILTYDSSGSMHVIPNLNDYFHQKFNEPKTLPAANVKPRTPGVGEVWVDTQFEKTAGKSKSGTATAVDTSTWEVSKKVALPGVNMDNPHNMWTDKDQKLIYQTQWFSDKLDVWDRETLRFIREITVGPAPSHVMTRTDTDQLHVALNGGNAVVELSPGATSITRRLLAQRPGEQVAHPHAHWMSSDGTRMVTPDPNTNQATLFDVPSGMIISKPTLETIPIASSMASDDSRYYIANLLSHSLSCVSMGAPACNDHGHKVARKTIRFNANYDPVSGPKGGYGLLPIQTPVSPDNKYMLTANTTSGTVAVIDLSKDEVVKYLPCDPGCHGINFGAKKGGGYYGYLSNKFSNRMQVIDADPNHDGKFNDAKIVGSLVLDAGGATRGDDTVTQYAGLGGQGVLAVPLVYNGWVQKVPQVAPFDQLTAEQRNPLGRKPS
jgi:DNA-binding beta-propeller fold protein YncE